MEQYLINDTTLSAIGDSLRNKLGDTKIEVIEYTMPYLVSKTPNAKSFTERNGSYPNSASIYDFITIPGATKIKVKMAYQTESPSYDYVQVIPGKITVIPSDATKYGGSFLTPPIVELEFDNTDTITFYFKTDGSNNMYLGYYAECTGYDADGNVIECLMQEEKEVPNTFLPTEMSVAIDNMHVVPPEAYNITGDCRYRFAYDGWSWFLNQCGNEIKTNDITNLEYMFDSSFKLITVPFDINMKIGGSNVNATYMFNNCYELKILPVITNFIPNNLNGIFSACYSLREIPEDWCDAWDWSYMDKQTSAYSCNRSNTFSYCYSLRKFPMSFLAHANPVSYSGYVMYYSLFQNCAVLDEVLNLPIPYTTAYTSNTFNYTFNNCYRLKNITFETNEDGSPKVIQWKSQTIDLTQEVGYSSAYGGNVNITKYNSGITADKYVNDDASYQALKNDPDWFGSIRYSRYNHDSAVATINSLPDASAYLATTSGTNTIKFKGAAGANTDGGAINTLTAEEIAVATAKGWTVTLV